MIALVKKCLVPAAAALASMGFTAAPSVPAAELAGAERLAELQQGPQGAQKKSDDDSTFVGLDDLALASWPGLAGVSSVGSLSSPLSSPLTGGPGSSKPPQVADRLPPKPPQMPGIPAGRVMPTAPVEPLSQYMP